MFNKKKKPSGLGGFCLFILYEVELKESINRGLNDLFVYDKIYLFIYMYFFFCQLIYYIFLHQQNPCCNIKKHLFGIEITKMYENNQKRLKVAQNKSIVAYS